MSDDNAEEPKLVTYEEFSACDLEVPIAALKHTDMPMFAQAFQQAATVAQPPCREVYFLLGALCGIHLHPAERGIKWTPGYSYRQKRSILPSDVRGAQSDVIESQLSRVNNPALRARLADIVWSNELSKGNAAKIALAAYCDCIDGLVSGNLVPTYDLDGFYLIEAQPFAQRALQIAFATSKKRAPLPPRIVASVSGLYVEALNKNRHVPFGRFAQLAVDYKIIGEERVVADAETIAAKECANPEAVRIILDYAQGLYQRLGDLEAQERCGLAAVRQLLRMRDACGQAGAKASWVMDALLRLRSLKSTEAQALEDELETELRSLQKAALREMGSFQMPLDAPEERERILTHFQEIDLATALQHYAFLSASPVVTALKSAALEEGRRSGLGSIFPAVHVDHEGKTVVKTPALGDGEPPEEWYTHQIARAENIRRQIVVANSIESVRLFIGSKVGLEERHFNPIVWQSPFVPKTQAPLYALGFSRFFQGDFPSAAHILIPQLEPSLRHVLKTHGVEPTKRRDDTTEEDQSLDGILTNHRAVLEQVFGEDLLAELNRIFNQQPGPNLRHELAHGQISANECYSGNVIYGCWFLYRLVCLPLVENWDAWVRPGLIAEGVCEATPVPETAPPADPHQDRDSNNRAEASQPESLEPAIKPKARNLLSFVLSCFLQKKKVRNNVK